MKQSPHPGRALCAAALLCFVSVPPDAQAQAFCRYNRGQTGGLLNDWGAAVAHAKYCGFPAEAIRNDGIKAFAVQCTRFWMPQEQMYALMSLEPHDFIYKLNERQVEEAQPTKAQCDKALKDLRFYDKTARAEVARLEKQAAAARKRAEKNRIPERIVPPD